MTRGIARLKIPLAVSTVLSSATVLAQQVPQGTDGLEEIVVTAQKRAQRLQDVPLAVSAISGDEMDRKGAQDIHDILLSVPGLSYSSTEPGQSRYSIRGVSTAFTWMTSRWSLSPPHFPVQPIPCYSIWIAWRS
jgi:outer membrane receptor for ferrienterochelin and colicin